MVGLSKASQTYREPPHNIEAEQSLLGAILTNNDVMDHVSSFLKADHFFDPLHQRIFQTAWHLIQSGRQANPITLKDLFVNEPPITDDLTVPQYLVRLVVQATTIVNTEGFGKIIVDLHTRRNLISIGEEVVNKAYDSPIENPPETQIQWLEGAIFALSEGSQRSARTDTIASAIQQAIESSRRAHELGSGLAGSTTYLTDLDRVTGGMKDGELIVVAGRPAMGKTSLVTGIALKTAQINLAKANADTNAPKPKAVVFHSLEMENRSIGNRVLSQIVKFNSSDIASGNLDSAQYGELLRAEKEFRDVPLTLIENGGATLSEIVTRTRKFARQNDVDMVVIDYLQLVRPDPRDIHRPKHEQIGQVTSALKMLAKELRTKVVLLCQLSREVEKQVDCRPQLEHLKGSGDVEQDADQVWFIYRQEYYLQKRMPNEGSKEFAAWESMIEATRGKAEIIVGKNREGGEGSAFVRFDGKFAAFSDIVREQPRLDEYVPF